MDLEIVRQLLELGFPAVVLILFIMERAEHMRLRREYVNTLRQYVNLPPVDDSKPHEITLSWNGSAPDNTPAPTDNKKIPS